MKRVLPFLLLNVAISAATMLLVLVIWQSAHRTPIVEPPAFTPQAGLTQPPTADPASYARASIEIQNVIGAGDLDFEVVTLKNTGGDPVDLTAWTLRDDQGSRFTFPVFTVFPNGAFQVFSRAGVNTSLELYWGSTSALWKSGAKVFLYDPAGEKRREYTIP